ncbi:lysosomal acid glucosylceramidase-like [Ostrinia furnacalis]|uniref:lysosomal acid glucosylceramidase-like n=1 Tax=Ostrinia furnacalis TaxID=93504 RepID=UPI0010409DB3|nr:lysosomal acid glucosylceramidase-like [Ostrinia furnacalis]
MGIQRKVILLLTLVIQLSIHCTADKPCWSQIFDQNKSTVCLCTSEYCDELIRDEPSLGNYVAYTSSEDGLRFQKSTKSLQTFNFDSQAATCTLSNYCYPALYLNTSRLYQKVEGFGGAVTDAAAINWLSLENDTLRQHLIDAYFSRQGLEYNMIRVPIGGSDFSTHPYAYNEYPEDDVQLSNYTLAPEDYEYKLPMIKAAMEAAPGCVHVVASPWSPPAWMKTNNNITGISRLKKEYYQTYADYYLKFLQLYAKEGVQVWAVTTTNEPTNAVLSDTPFNTLGWTVVDQADWIANNLGPTLRKSQFNTTLILAVDDNRDKIVDYFNILAYTNPLTLQYIDGVAVHFYYNKLVPPEMLTFPLKNHPDIFVISTEACAGFLPNEYPKVDLGSWSNAQLYIRDIIEDLNYNVTGWIDWNLCLDQQGGPNWANNFVDSPIIIADDKQQFFKQPMYYALAHFSKFIPRGSRRIHVQSLCKKNIENVSFLTPFNTIVTVLHNSGEATMVDLVTCHRLASVEVRRNSITTVEFVNEPC